MMKHIEDAILSTFLFSNDFGLNMDEVFKLDVKAFTSPYSQRVAERINSVSDGCYGYLMTQIEEKTVGTVHEAELIDIMAQTPLVFSIAKRYHNDLVKQNRLRGAV